MTVCFLTHATCKKVWHESYASGHCLAHTPHKTEKSVNWELEIEDSSSRLSYEWLVSNTVVDCWEHQSSSCWYWSLQNCISFASDLAVNWLIWIHNLAIHCFQASLSHPKSLSRNLFLGEVVELDLLCCKRFKVWIQNISFVNMSYFYSETNELLISYHMKNQNLFLSWTESVSQER